MAYDQSRRGRFLTGLRRSLEETRITNDRKSGLKEFVQLVRNDFDLEDYPEFSAGVEKDDLERDIKQIGTFHAQGDEGRCAFLRICIGKTLGIADPLES